MSGQISDSDDDGSVVGTSGSDTIFGGVSTGSADGGDAINDTIDGGQSDDTIFAGDGDDLIFGGDAGDAAGGGTAMAKTVDSFVFDTDNATDVSEGSGPGNIGDQITYNNIATADDGTQVSVRITIVGMSNTNLDVELGRSDTYPLYLNGGLPGEKVDIRIDFLDQNGDPVTIDSSFTFRDLDDTGARGNEGVTFDTTDITSFAVSDDPATDVVADDRGDVIEFTTTTSGGANNENLWTQVFFEGQSSLNFTVESREGGAGYGFDTAGFSNPPVISEVDGSGDDLLFGGAGDDSALGGGGNDQIHGDEGQDTLDGGKGDDTLFGGSGDDVLVGGTGTNTLFGGEGQDTADYSDAEEGVEVNLRDGTADLGGGSSERLTSIENVTGSSFDDTLEGSDVANMIEGGAGDDDIKGNDGDDLLLGGTGDDVVKGDAGNDTLAGGEGTDTLFGGDDHDVWSFDSDAAGDSFDGGRGEDMIDASGLSEDLTVSFSNDEDGSVLTGGGTGTFEDVERVQLGSGDDTVDASASQGGVSVDAGAGNDTLIGGSGGDTLRGGAGDDTIASGAGPDAVSGGEGQDTFVIHSADYSDLGTGPEISDAILDLNLAGIEDWQAAKGHGTGDETGGQGDPSDIDVGKIGKAVDDSLKRFIGKHSANEAEKIAEKAVKDFLEQNNGEPIVPKDISDVVFEALQPEYGTLLAGGAGLKVFGEAREQLGVTDGGTNEQQALHDEIASRANDLTIEDFELGTDRLDLSQHDYLGSTGLSTNDVKITDTAGDGSGDAVLNLPDGSTITLQDVSVYDLDPETLESMGFEASDDSTGFQNAFLTEAGQIGGGGGNDVIEGSANVETISGGSGDDVIKLGGGADSVSGGDGKDAIVVGDNFHGANIDGGEGTDKDQLDFSDLDRGITVSSTGADDGAFFDADINTGSFQDIEKFTGTDFSDRIVGGTDATEIDTGAGNDEIDGGGGDDILIAGAGDDSASGGDGSDLIYGGDGDDQLSTGIGNDTLFGGQGDDVLRNSAGNDTLSGGSGNDELIASEGDDLLYGGTGNDALYGGVDDDALYGGDGADTLDGGDQNDAIFGGDGDDRLLAGFGADTFDGGTGTDTLDIAASSVSGVNFDIDLVAGNDQYGNQYNGIENIIGGSQGDSILGDASDNTFEGQGGADTLAGGAGDDLIYGGDGADSLTTGTGNDTLFGGAGDDNLANSTGNDTLYGGTGEDTITASAGDDLLYGEAGNDSLSGGIDDDTLYGGTGNDTLNAGQSSDTVYGGTGSDTFETSLGSNTLYGGDDEDEFGVGFGTDTIFGGSGGTDQDTLTGATADDALTVTFTDSEDGTFTDSDGDSGSFDDIESFVLTSEADSLDGSASTTAITVDAGAGDDTLTGGSGADVFSAGAGNDTLTGGAGDDTLTGGAGDDVFVLSASGGSDTVTDFGTGTDQVDSSALTDVGNALTNQDGTVTADEVTVTGGGGSDQVLTFPSGETLTVPDGTVDTSTQATQFASLVAMGVPPCFAPGTAIMTAEGPHAVEDLRIGDLVMTADNGPQRLRWIGRRTETFSSREDRHLPILFQPGSLGTHGPDRRLIVSPQHRMVISGPEVAARFDVDEILAPAKVLTDLPGVRVMRGRPRIDYIALLFDRHEIIFAEGVATESFRPGPVVMQGFAPDVRAEIHAIYPDLRDHPIEGLGPAARIIVGKRITREIIADAARKGLLVAS